MLRETNQEANTHQALYSAATLRDELAGFRISTSRFCHDLSLEHLLADVTDCRLVKKNIRRRLFFLKTPDNSYYLKLSTLIRSKDRLRHFLLPRRRWAEWHNLHRLRNLQISAAKPLLIGEGQDRRPASFFLLTEDVGAVPLKFTVPADARKLGRFVQYLHSCNVYHADLHPNNILFRSAEEPFLIDAQDIFFPPVMPRWLRLTNLGKVFFHLPFKQNPALWAREFLDGYNSEAGNPVTAAQLIKSAERYQQRHFRSRSKRCLKNSTEFRIVKEPGLRGYKRRRFAWGLPELEQALARGKTIKPESVIAYRDVCIKVNRLRLFHQDRCLAGWKMSRALEVREIMVPRALGYMKTRGQSCFLSEFLVDSQHLNDYLSSLAAGKQKRGVLKKIGQWLKTIHQQHIWQRDFKSSNVLWRNGHCYLIDLDSVRIRHLSAKRKIINLAQLNASLSNAVTVRDRLRCFHYYSAGEAYSRQQRRAIYKHIWDITCTKNTAIYNLDLETLRP
jgi:tRNA A-37 threonylcarbamoyl transferase component Bud32